MSHSHHEHGGKTSERFIDKNKVLDSLKILPGQQVLDAGCGNGYMSREFAILVGKAGKVFACDVHEVSVEQFKAEAAGTNIDVALGDVTNKTDLADGAVEVVYLSMVFHGFTDVQREGFVKEVKRVLKPGGVLAIVELDKVDTPFGPPMELRFSPEDMREAIGLTPGECVKINGYTYMQLFTA